jgi:hypothetical protein
METLVWVFIWIMLVFLAEVVKVVEHGQQSVLKIAKSTVEEHSLLHICVASEAGNCALLYITPCTCKRASVKE